MARSSPFQRSSDMEIFLRRWKKQFWTTSQYNYYRTKSFKDMLLYMLTKQQKERRDKAGFDLLRLTSSTLEACQRGVLSPRKEGDEQKLGLNSISSHLTSVGQASKGTARRLL